MKKQKFIYSVLMIFLVSIITFIGCQQEESSSSLNDNEAYLSLSPNVDFTKLTKGDWEIISQAFTRLNLKENEDGLFEIPHKSGKEINISNELFNYFQLVLKSSNEKITSGVYIVRNRTRTPDESINANTDCVARSIAYATGKNYYEINAWLTQTYGSNGVPPDKFYSAMNHFCNGAQVGLSMFYSMNIPFNSNNKYVIILGAQHAVNLKAKNGSDIIYYDAQNGGTVLCSVSVVTHVYEIR